MAELSDNIGGAGHEIREASRSQITETLVATGKLLDFYIKSVGK